MADHWWWRPGWRVGRRGYAWHLTFRDDPDVHRLAAVYRQGLAGLTELDLVPDASLHLTMQQVGFVDEVTDEQVRLMVEAAKRRLSVLPPFDLELVRPVITREAVRWDPVPVGPVVAVRLAIRQAMAEVWPLVPGREAGFVPHVSIAYSNAPVAYAAVASALALIEAPPARARIEKADLIVIHRDQRMYEWAEHAAV